MVKDLSFSEQRIKWIFPHWFCGEIIEDFSKETFIVSSNQNREGDRIIWKASLSPLSSLKKSSFLCLCHLSRISFPECDQSSSIRRESLEGTSLRHPMKTRRDTHIHLFLFISDIFDITDETCWRTISFPDKLSLLSRKWKEFSSHIDGESSLPIQIRSIEVNIPMKKRLFLHLSNCADHWRWTKSNSIHWHFFHFTNINRMINISQMKTNFLFLFLFLFSHRYCLSIHLIFVEFWTKFSSSDGFHQFNWQDFCLYRSSVCLEFHLHFPITIEHRWDNSIVVLIFPPTIDHWMILKINDGEEQTKHRIRCFHCGFSLSFPLLSMFSVEQRSVMQKQQQQRQDFVAIANREELDCSIVFRCPSDKDWQWRRRISSLILVHLGVRRYRRDPPACNTLHLEHLSHRREDIGQREEWETLFHRIF